MIPIRKLRTIGVLLLSGFCAVLMLTLAFATPDLVEKRNAPGKPLQVTVQARRLNPVSDRLFGHFLERASFGEPGPENALLPGTRQIQPRAIALMQQMQVPIIRFPAGTDVDYIDWRNLISNVPGRGQERPASIGHTGQSISNNFGIDEYFRLQAELKNQTILMVNFLDAVSKKVSLNDAALNAAGLIAYTNAPVGTQLPRGMPDWPAVRAKNGHPRPYKVEYLQIGNEWWADGFQQRVRQGTELTKADALAQWYLTCLKAYINQIHAVDPSVKIIIDGKMGQDMERIVLADADIRQQVQYVAFHIYAPGPVQELRREGQRYPPEKMTAGDWWRAWVAMPGEFSLIGENEAVKSNVEFAQSLGYRVAVTEWNWNGWNFGKLEPEPKIDWRFSSAVGTAGFLNGLMRQGAGIDMACQSLLIGSNWDITSIRVDPEAMDVPYFFPQGQMTMFFSQHHGQHRLAVKLSHPLTYPQPIAMGWAQSPPKQVAFIDLVATMSDRAIYIHAINRYFEHNQSLLLDLSAFPRLDGNATHHLFKERSHSPLDQIQSWLVEHEQPKEVGEITAQPLRLQKRTLSLTLPQRSVSIVEIPLR
jgi:alpha-L-arabinofuranosidase